MKTGIRTLSIQKTSALITALALVWLMLWGAVLAPVAQALNLQPVQVFYVPLPENQLYTSFVAIAGSAVGTTVRTVTGINVTSGGTAIYYDHWEDGFELDIANPTQASTLIFGDGNTANGNACPMVQPAAFCSNDLITAGAVIVLNNTLIAVPRNPATIVFDGGDKIASTKAIAVTKSTWGDPKPGSVLADAVEVNDTTRWGTQYTIPIGVNVGTTQIFEYVSLQIMAGTNGTVVQIDADANGVAETTVTLNQGESYQLNSGVKVNATVTASKPVEVNLVTGDIASRYENRWFTIAPTAQWGNSYFTAVTTTKASNASNVWLFNPNDTPLTVTYATGAGTGTVVVPAKSTVSYLMPLLSGAHFYTTDGRNFAALGTMDSNGNAADNETYDWGYTLVAEAALTTALSVGWAPGTGDLSANGSPVWVTAVKPTTIYVDYDGNPATGPSTAPNGARYDVSFAVSALASVQVYDPDKDQTGMRLFTTDGTQITGAWGEDPSTAKAGNPYLDMGYTIPPLPQAIAEKIAALAVDPGGNSAVDPGDTLEYTINVRNQGIVTFFNTIATDPLPTNTAYVPNSTTVNGVSVADNVSPATAYPLDETGLNVGNTPVLGTTQVKFRVTLQPGSYTSVAD